MGDRENYTQNRDISWIRFNERVLNEANDVTVPLFEKLKFISIFMSNLDEFFMVRADEIDREMYGMIPPLYERKDKLIGIVEIGLKSMGIRRLEYADLTEEEESAVNDFYENVVYPRLSPQVITRGEPFPNLKNKITYIVGTLFIDNDTKFAVLEVPEQCPEYLVLPDKDGKLKYIMTEDIVKERFNKIMAPFAVTGSASVSVTRQSAILTPVRLDVRGSLNDVLKDYLKDSLDLEDYQIFSTRMLMDLGYVYDIEKHLTDEQKENVLYPAFEPKDTYQYSIKSMIETVKEKDVLSCYPYDSMGPMLRLLKEAADSPDVREIRMTLYRLAGNSKVVDYLCRAAENGKRVRVLVELRASFDEQNNIDWSEKLEEAGCAVYYGKDDYKVHAKICQIVLKEGGEKKYITQFGTGNYNEKTAKQYTDFSIITYEQHIGRDASRFISDMFKGETDGDYEILLTAPSQLKERFLMLIDREIRKGRAGRIFLKVNAIDDDDVIDKLVEASRAGVKIRIIARGICRILPGIPGDTENIEIVSVVGRFLEHSRAYLFGSGESEVLYVSSADLMTRNLENRVEMACPVVENDLKERIKRIMLLNFNDNIKGRYLGSSGEYVKKPYSETSIDSQEALLNLNAYSDL